MVLTTTTSSYEFLSQLLSITTIMAPLMVILLFFFTIFIEHANRRHQSKSRTQSAVVNTIQKEEEANLLEEDSFDKHFEKIMQSKEECTQRPTWTWDSELKQWIPKGLRNDQN